MSQPTHAIVRGVSDSFADALAGAPPVPPLDVALARAQHAAYVRALVDVGLEVHALPADPRFPDACFIEDTAVIARGVALVTRPGAPSRQGETAAVLAHLREAIAGLVVYAMDAPATLDGGDCLRVGSRLYVGRSARTNDAGIARLGAAFGPVGLEVVPVALPAGVLHLKTVCSALSDTGILLAEGTLAADVFIGVQTILVPAAEAHAANVVVAGPTRRDVLVSADAPLTQARIAAHGFVVHPVGTSELRRADGALTCLSLLY